MRKTFRNSTHLVIDNAGHESMLVDPQNTPISSSEKRVCAWAWTTSESNQQHLIDQCLRAGSAHYFADGAGKGG